LHQPLSYDDLVDFLKLKAKYEAANLEDQFILVESFINYMDSLAETSIKFYFLKRREFSLSLVRHYFVLKKAYDFRLPLKTVCILFVKGFIGYKGPLKDEKSSDL